MIKWKVVLTIFLVSSLLIKAQDINTNRFQYISPVPGSSLNSPETNIIIRFGNAFSNNDIANSLSVVGNKSGQHEGEIILAENGRTLIFKPKNKFVEGEVVTVKLGSSLQTISGEQVPVLQYSFKTSKIDLNEKIKSNREEYLKFLNEQFELSNDNFVPKNKMLLGVFNQISNKFQTIQKDSLPDDFPKAYADSINNPTPGYIFYTPFGISNYSPTYLIITDKYGVPVFYRKLDATAFDFKELNDSTLAYFSLGWKYQYYIMNNSYEIIDSVSTQNDYITDLHDIIRLENGHTFLLSYDYEKVRMDTIVAGGDSNATVIGTILQELDENKNVVFQWRSWDHVNITDATYDINLKASTIDYIHTNSIEIDYDGNILLSNRYFDEITKIDRQTGNTIWRLGGKYCKNNEFTFLNDPEGFSHQHDVRRLPNGNITLFDNGNLHNPRYSRVAEYQVDEVNKFVSLVWEYKNDPETFTPAMGSARRLSNHNTIIGWGASTAVGISEVQPNGDISFYLTMPDTLFNYRAFKFPWKTNLFVTDPSSLNFGYVPPGDSSIQTLSIINNSDKEIEINGVLNRDSAFTMLAPLPIRIDAFGNTTFQVEFKPKELKAYYDNLYLQWNKKNQRVTQILKLSATRIVDVENRNNNFNFSLVQNYPNPFNPTTKIEYSIPHQSFVILKVYDILGREVVTLVNEEKAAGNYNVAFDGSALSSGVYFYKIQTGNFVEVKKMILLK